jgi:thiol-disulfide isomerase/thioredoxin
MKSFYIIIFTAFFFQTTNAQTKSKSKINTKSNKVVLTSSSNKNIGLGHNIFITLTPAKNQKAYLGCYYGKSKAIIDSCMLDENCKGRFIGEKKLVGGVYFVVSQAYSIQFELLIGDDQEFSIIGDTTHKENFNIVGSPDNDIFKKYTKVSFELGTAINNLSKSLGNSVNAADSATIRTQIKEKNDEMMKYRNEIIEKNPSSLMAALLTAMRRPEAPPIPYDSLTKKYDSTYPYIFIKEHFWDDVDFADERLLRTPFFDPKVDEYLKYYVFPEPDSIIPEIKFMLLSARESKEMYAYLLTKFTNKYINPEYMGQDKVFVYLFTDHYLKGDTTVLDAKSRRTIIDRGYSLMLNQLGNIAPALDLTDTTGKIVSMYDLKAKFTLVAYWDPTCGHCRTELPLLDSIYKAKWNKLNVAVYSIISKDDLVAEMKKFIKEKNLSNQWHYTYETKAQKEATEKAGLPNFRQGYDLNKTPIFYLLDADKRIIGKNLTINQIDDLISKKLSIKQ